MEKTTLLFPSLIELARFSKVVSTGYLMNTNKCTLTGRFTDEEVDTATNQFDATVIETTDKVFTY